MLRRDGLLVDELKAVFESEVIGKVLGPQLNGTVVGLRLRRETRASFVGARVLRLEQQEATRREAGVDVCEKLLDALVAPVEMYPFRDTKAAIVHDCNETWA